MKVAVLALVAMLVLTGPQVQPATAMNSYVVNYLEQLFAKLRVITQEEPSCISEEAEAVVCMGPERMELLEQIAEDCDVDLETLKANNFQPPLSLNETEMTAADEEQQCVLKALGWMDDDGNIVDAGVIADLETGPIGSDATMVVEGVRATVNKITWHNVDQFKRSGVEPDLFADPPRYPKRANDDQLKLVAFLKNFMYLVLVKRASQEYCLKQVNAELLKPTKQRFKEDLLDNLMLKLKPLGESDSPLDPEVEEKICVDADMVQEVEDAADACGVDPDSVSYLGRIQGVEDLTPEEYQQLAAKRLCINTELEWINVDENGEKESLHLDNIKADLTRTVLRENAAATADDCYATAMNVDFDNIRTFARTGLEADLVEDNGDNAPAADTPEEQDERDKLVCGIQEYVFFNCLRREIEAACLPEANCQLMNLETLSDNCPAPDDGTA